MSFSLVTQGMLRADLPDTSWAGLISRFGYTIGFLLVVLARQQLFTENTLTPILPLLSQRTLACLLQVFAAWLIAMMVWLLPTAETARVGVIIIVTYVVGVAHLAHNVAGSVETLYVVMMGEATWGAYGSFMAATLLGNILGGVRLVALFNYGQVFSGEVTPS